MLVYWESAELRFGFGVVVVVWDTVSCSPGWPQTCCQAEAGPWTGRPVSISLENMLSYASCIRGIAGHFLCWTPGLGDSRTSAILPGDKPLKLLAPKWSKYPVLISVGLLLCLLMLQPWPAPLAILA